MMRYSAIHIDPPWVFEVWSKDTGNDRSPEAHYPTLTTEILMELPLHKLMMDDCAVFMWATWPRLPDALALGAAWGLTYKTLAFDWLKRTSTGNHWHMGMGYWSRANSEPCLLFTKGHPQRRDKGVPQLIVDNQQPSLFPPMVARVMGHSAKPIETYERIERLIEPPYIDVFARHQRTGWDAIGNAIDGHDIRDVLETWESAVIAEKDKALCRK